MMLVWICRLAYFMCDYQTEQLCNTGRTLSGLDDFFYITA